MLSTCAERAQIYAVVPRFESRQNYFWVGLSRTPAQFSRRRDLARRAAGFSPREIPRPAGESAGLRNDAFGINREFQVEALTFMREHSPMRYRIPDN